MVTKTSPHKVLDGSLSCNILAQILSVLMFLIEVYLWDLVTQTKAMGYSSYLGPSNLQS